MLGPTALAFLAGLWYNFVGQRHMWRFSFRGGPGVYAVGL